MPEIGIVIPYYRAPESLTRCLEQIKLQTFKNHEVFVRDNSNDNILFTAAVNEGIRHFIFNQNAKYVLILNQDAYLEADAIEVLHDFMEKNPGCGIAGAMQVTEDWEVSWAGSLSAYPNGVHKTGALDEYLEVTETYWANGACMMIRREVVHEIGLLDKNLRFICSDSDYSFTARTRGWKIHVVPNALCIHSVGKSGKANNPELEKIKYLDSLYFSAKWIDGGLYRSLAINSAKVADSEIEKIVARIKTNIDYFNTLSSL